MGEGESSVFRNRWKACRHVPCTWGGERHRWCESPVGLLTPNDLEGKFGVLESYFFQTNRLFQHDSIPSLKGLELGLGLG